MVVVVVVVVEVGLWVQQQLMFEEKPHHPLSPKHLVKTVLLQKDKSAIPYTSFLQTEKKLGIIMIKKIIIPEKILLQKIQWYCC